jgi:hypothetical protein
MKGVVALLGAAVAVACVAGCSGSGGGGTDLDKPPKGVFVGGNVSTIYEIPLAGADITLVSADGEESLTVVSSESGLFELEDVREGVYRMDVSLAGFVTRSLNVVADAQDNDAFAPCFGGCDDDDGTPTYVFVGNVYLGELPPSVSISPFGLEPGYHELLADGVAGNVIEYDISADQDIVVTVGRPVVTGNAPYLQNAQGLAVYPVPNLDRTVFTFAEAALPPLGVNEGQKITLYSDALGTISPLYGGLENTYFTVRYRVVP